VLLAIKHDPNMGPAPRAVTSYGIEPAEMDRITLAAKE
jgi:hypothetical protein